MAKKPVIGITLDWAKEGSFSQRPHYALREDYFDTVEKAGGVPIGLPYNEKSREEYLALVDGILIPGGTIAKPIEWYEEGTKEPAYAHSPRLVSDIWYTRQALEKKIPFLGICEGMQVMAGVLGCKLTADVHKTFKTDINHARWGKGEEFAHKVKIYKGTKLHSILGVESGETNSLHREGVFNLPEDVVLAATAEDGVIEAIEAKEHPFALGLEWHPEYFSEKPDPDFKILQAFIKTAASYRGSK